ncbi:hypothetical protein Taro_036660 [Colocasia esculenta]|uniref:RNase H type-1 domain-containing protein n=1 Tax=Colocasia esculenta TaxID=4460 RepID=A0A843WMB0_COLES|nr:hypothetical protein [Colocasia esculenta]
MIAEARAFCDGLRLADFLGLQIAIVNSDFLALVNSLKSGRCPLWQAYRWWREVDTMIQKKNLLFGHVYRETNQVADGLANFGCLSKENKNYELWKIVDKGPDELPEDESLWTKDQINKSTLSWSAMNMMQCAIHPKEYSRVSSCKSAKEIVLRSSSRLLHLLSSQVFMAPKKTPKRGAKSRAAAKGVVIEEPPVERRSKFRHDPSKRKTDSVHTGTPSKRGRSTPQSKGKSPMPSRYPKRKVQTLFAKEVSTHPTMVSTHQPRFKGKKIPGFRLLRSTHSQGRSTLDSVPRTACLQNWDSRSTQDQSRSTLDSVPRTAFSQVWDSVSTPPPGQVDTLRKDCNLNWMSATCQPRAMGINLGSCALVPKGYLWNLLGIKGPQLAIHHERTPTNSPSLQKSSLWQREEFISLFCSPGVLHDSSSSDEDGSSFNGTPSKRQLLEESSSDTSESPVATPSKYVTEGRFLGQVGGKRVGHLSLIRPLSGSLRTHRIQMTRFSWENESSFLDVIRI